LRHFDSECLIGQISYKQEIYNNYNKYDELTAALENIYKTVIKIDVETQLKKKLKIKCPGGLVDF